MPSKKKPAKKAPAKPVNKAKLKAQIKAAREGKAIAKPKAKANARPKAKAAAKPSPAAKPKAKPKAQAKPVRLPDDHDIRQAMAGKSQPPALSVRGLVSELIAEQKHTDEEIIIAVSKALPDNTINKNIIGACRSEMNFGRRVPKGQDPARRYEQVLNVGGVNMLRSERPPKPGKARKPARGKVASENDPLAKLGIQTVKRSPTRRATAPA